MKPNIISQWLSIIDNIARPMNSLLDDIENEELKSRQIGPCKWEAETKLLLAGAEIGLDAVIEYMTGGTATLEVEGDFVYTLANIERIYYDYEVCMGRWH